MNTRSIAKITFLQLVLYIVVSVDSIRNLPAAALFGSSLIFFYLVASLFFLIPVGLVSAELSARFKHPGGVYVWVREAFGLDWGFMAVWLQWLENVIWYPTILSTVAGTLGYLISPDFAEHPYHIFWMVVIIFWSLTWLNSRGMQTSVLFSSICTVGGLFIPMAVIIALGATWIIGGQPLAITFDWQHMIPHGHQSHLWVALTGIILSFCGMELATVHCTDVVNPERSFPRALLYSTLIIMVTLVLGALSIAVVLPHEHISLVTGIIQAFSAFLMTYHLEPLLPFFALMIALGGLGTISNWLLSPVRSLLLAARDGRMPSHFAATNAQGMPQRMLVYQAILVTLMATAFLLFPHLNNAYWFLTVSASQIYMLMYILMFITFLVHRQRNTHGENLAYRIPGGQPVAWLIAIIGIVGSSAPLLIGFIPPEGDAFTHIEHYSLWVLATLLMFVLPPLWITIMRHARHSR